MPEAGGAQAVEKGPSSAAARWIFLIAAAAIGFFSSLSTIPLFDLDEGAFSEATREMVVSGNYVSPTLNGEPRYDKPILIYWLQAASVKLLGLRELALRLPSAICASLWMLAVFRFTRRHTGDPRAAALAAGSVALSLMSSLIGHAAIADALLNLLLALSLLGIYNYFETRGRAGLLAVYAAIGFGLLAKGPIALALPLAVSLAFAIWRKDFGLWLRAAFDPLGWALMAIIVAPWVLWSYRADGGDFLRHFLFDHNIGRYSHTMQGHGGKPWYYLLWLPLILLPFTTALLVALRDAARSRDPLSVFLMLWFLGVFIVFSFSATQLPHYLLYGCTPLFVLMGRAYARLPMRLLTLLPALLVCAALASLPWTLRYFVPAQGHEFERGILELAVAAFDERYRLISFGALAAVVFLMVTPGLSRARALLGAGLAQAAVVWFAVMPVFAGAQQEPIREAAGRASQLQTPVVSYETYLPSFSFYRGAITPMRLPAPGELVFVRLDRLDELQKVLGAEPLIPEFRRGGVALLRRAGELPAPPPGDTTAPSD